MDNGEEDTDSYRRFGLGVENDSVYLNSQVGKDELDGTFDGNLALMPNTTYSTLLAILPDGEFLHVIWDPSDPTETLSYLKKFDETWFQLSWAFHLPANKGSIIFDNYQEIRFGGLK
jgi:hypothetical protein